MTPWIDFIFYGTFNFLEHPTQQPPFQQSQQPKQFNQLKHHLELVQPLLLLNQHLGQVLYLACLAALQELLLEHPHATLHSLSACLILREILVIQRTLLKTNPVLMSC